MQVLISLAFIKKKFSPQKKLLEKMSDRQNLTNHRKRRLLQKKADNKSYKEFDILITYN